MSLNDELHLMIVSISRSEDPRRSRDREFKREEHDNFRLSDPEGGRNCVRHMVPPHEDWSTD